MNTNIVDNYTPLTIRQKLQNGLENAFGVSPTTEQIDHQPKMTQKEAFFAGLPFTLFPLGNMPMYKFEPSLYEEVVGPTLNKIRKGVDQEYHCVTEITDLDFTVYLMPLGLYRWKKTIPFTDLNFVVGWNGRYDNPMKNDKVIGPSEDTLLRLELESGWMVIQPAGSESI